MKNKERTMKFDTIISYGNKQDNYWTHLGLAETEPWTTPKSLVIRFREPLEERKVDALKEMSDEKHETDWKFEHICRPKECFGVGIITDLQPDEISKITQEQNTKGLTNIKKIVTLHTIYLATKDLIKIEEMYLKKD
jgi:hypothetical protein